MTEIEKYNPCQEAVRFRKEFDSFQEAWEACPRGDWMLWIAQRVGVDLRTLTRAKALCALTVKHLMKDERSVRACEVSLKFADGEATLEELAAAVYAAASAVYAAASAATYAAAYAAYAAANRYRYTDVAIYAASATIYASAINTGRENQKQTADICRENLTEVVFEKLGLK